MNIIETILFPFKKLVNKAKFNYSNSKNDIDLFGGAILATNLLMWAYTLVVVRYVDSSVVKYVCITVCFIQSIGFLSLFYLAKENFKLLANVLIAGGLIYQIFYNYYTGGFATSTLVWLGANAVFAGVLLERKWVYIWAVISVFVGCVFFFSYVGGYNFPRLLNPKGVVYIEFLTKFGWIGVLAYVISIFCTAQEQSRELLNKKNEKIDNLLTILTHDINNSLTVLKMANEMSKVTGDTKELQETMDRASFSIGEVVNNVRVLHRAENDMDVIKCVPCNLDDSIEKCTKMLSGLAAKKGVNFRYADFHCPDTKVLMDPMYFNHHVLENVLSNAIKFSKFNGNVDIGVRVNDGEVELVVKDYGVGIPKTSLVEIFQNKVNRSTPGTDGEKGTGFGLNILNMFMKKFDGRVLIKSISEDEGCEHGTEVRLVFKAIHGLSNFETNDFRFGNLVVKGV
ncbi:MAG: hypothetical protein CME64_11515 [Halobacteriovoraceae bacterium]|nr:hypothetical protein [Halobacteriovoraceae bacterium]|tara:strand:+ start:51001 stop:52362 length:1362 start_codon:yes stop_codon:yes gene_type:complete